MPLTRKKRAAIAGRISLRCFWVATHASPEKGEKFHGDEQLQALDNRLRLLAIEANRIGDAAKAIRDLEATERSHR